jgi:hypothetical protein
MKKALLALTVTALSASVFAQSTDGSFNFKTAAVGKLDGSGSYNVPLYASNGDNIQNGVAVGYTGNTTQGNSTVAAGTIPSGVTVGLFLTGSSTPFAQGTLGTSGGTALYVASPAPAQTVSVPGQPVGATPTIIIRAWQTSAGSLAAAQVTPGAQWGEWTITSKPLGGTPAGGGTPITPPSLSGWGSEVAPLGFELNQTVPEPTTVALGVLGIGALVLARRRK